MALTELPLLDPATVAASPLSGRVVFVLAPPGSGGEAVEAALLTCAGTTGRGVPSDLFARGLGGVLNNWAHGVTSDGPGPGPVGEHGIAVLTGAQPLLAALRELADAVLGGADGATDGPPALVVEYSPEHARWTPFLVAVFPDATYVHVVRDGRCLAAADSGDPATAATDWAVMTRRLLAVPPEVTVHRIRVEDLRTDPSRLGVLADALGLVVDQAAVDVLRAGLTELEDPRVPRGVTDAVDAAGGDLLAELGYEGRAAQ